MAASTAEVYKKKQLVLYKNKLCVIDDIQMTHLGYRCFTAIDIVSGEYFHVPKHALQRPDIQELPYGSFGHVNFDEEITMPVFIQSCSASATAVQETLPACTAVSDTVPTSSAATDSVPVSTSVKQTVPTSTAVRQTAPVSTAVRPSVPASTAVRDTVPARTDAQHSVSRHALLHEHQIDEIACSCLSDNSMKQTKWAVSLFRGKYTFYINYKHN